MHLLLDTHAFLWTITADPRLGSHSRTLITNQASGVRLGHVSLGEIAIKHSLARADMPLSAAQAMACAEQSALTFSPSNCRTC
jgi:PIN domain nuclease of toxin-antitoxin system